MTTIVTRAGKGLPLSWNEVDANFVNLQTKLDLSTNVKDFGAIGNGIADDTAAIQAAIDSMTATGGGLLVIPPGTYNQTTTLTLKTGVNILAYGATLSYSGSGVQITTPTTGVLVGAGIMGGVLNGGSSCTKQVELYSPYRCAFRDVTFVSNNATCYTLDILVNTTGDVNSDGNRNAAFNLFDNVLQDGICGTVLRMSGHATEPTVVTLNTFLNLNSRGASVRGIEFKSWCDSNYFAGITRMSLVANNAVGVEWNTETPAANIGVYSNNFSHLAVDTFGSYTGRIGLKQNWTKFNQVDYYFNEPAAEGGSCVFHPTDTQSYYVAHVIASTSNIYVRSKLMYQQGKDNPLFAFGSPEVTTETVGVEIGLGRTGSGYSYLDLIGDTTYPAYGTRLLRANGGANTDSQLLHRGTGNLTVKTEDAGGQIILQNSTGIKFVTNDLGVGFHGAAGYAKPTITGSRGANAALGDLLAQLEAYGLITDDTIV